MSVDFIRNVLLVSAIVLFIVVFYRWLLRYFRRNQLVDTYVYVHPFPRGNISGKLKIRIEIPEERLIACYVFPATPSEADRVKVYEAQLEAGDHEFEFDTVPHGDGDYIFEIESRNQSIRRRVRIAN